MWVLPKQLISASALDTEALISDSSEFSQVAEQSLMWRSKPSQSRTWSQRWKRETWMRHLSGRTLRHSQQNRFAAWWTSSLAATRANRSRQQASDSEQKTQDTSGRFYAEQYELFSPEESSSKTSKDTSRLDSPQSSATWKKMVTAQRGEYLARLKSEQATRERESSSSGNWPTPGASQAHINGQGRSTVEEVSRQKTFHLKHRTNKSGEVVVREKGRTHQATLASAVVGEQNWPTARTRDWKDIGDQQKLAKLYNRDQCLPRAVAKFGQQDLESSNSTGKNPAQWPTPKANNPSSTRKPGTGGRELSQEAKNWATPEAQNQTGYQTKNGQVFPRLGSQVESWPTPITGDSHLSSSPNAAQKRIQESKKTLSRMNPGKLNPSWVEQLMGVPVLWTQMPTEWTDSDCLATELCQQQQQEHGQF